MNHIKVARLALQMYASHKTDRVYAFNRAYEHLLEAQCSSMASDHLWICATIADISAVVEAGIRDSRIDVHPIILELTELLNDLAEM
jgi:hypothetical protein